MLRSTLQPYRVPPRMTYIITLAFQVRQPSGGLLGEGRTFLEGQPGLSTHCQQLNKNKLAIAPQLRSQR
jgi:hypothetical protein